MKLTKTQRLILHALGQFYQSLNQPLNEKPVKVRTSKITFIELLEQSDIFAKQKRALYKNLETLEKKKLLNYENHLIILTQEGLVELKKLTFELYQFSAIEKYFHDAEKPKRKLQTILEN
jgi:hypothetical protein